MLGNKFDHGAESVMPTLLNLVPNSAKVMATSGMAAIRLILRVRCQKRRVDVVPLGLFIRHSVRGVMMK